jgi:hypothetical protein
MKELHAVAALFGFWKHTIHIQVREIINHNYYELRVESIKRSFI